MGAAIVDLQCRLACPPKSECGPGLTAIICPTGPLRSPDSIRNAGRDKMRPDRARIVDAGAFDMALFSKAGALLDSLSPSMARKYGDA